MKLVGDRLVAPGQGPAPEQHRAEGDIGRAALEDGQQRDRRARGVGAVADNSDVHPPSRHSTRTITAECRLRGRRIRQP